MLWQMSDCLCFEDFFVTLEVILWQVSDHLCFEDFFFSNSRCDTLAGVWSSLFFRLLYETVNVMLWRVSDNLCFTDFFLKLLMWLFGGCLLVFVLRSSFWNCLCDTLAGVWLSLFYGLLFKTSDVVLWQVSDCLCFGDFFYDSRCDTLADVWSSKLNLDCFIVIIHQALMSVFMLCKLSERNADDLISRSCAMFFHTIGVNRPP